MWCFTKIKCFFSAWRSIRIRGQNFMQSDELISLKTFSLVGMSIEGWCFHVDERCFLHRWKTTDLFATLMFLLDIDAFNYLHYFCFALILIYSWWIDIMSRILRTFWQNNAFNKTSIFFIKHFLIIYEFCLIFWKHEFFF